MGLALKEFLIALPFLLLCIALGTTFFLLVSQGSYNKAELKGLQRVCDANDRATFWQLHTREGFYMFSNSHGELWAKSLKAKMIQKFGPLDTTPMNLKSEELSNFFRNIAAEYSEAYQRLGAEASSTVTELDKAQALCGQYQEWLDGLEQAEMKDQPTLKSGD